MGQYFTNENLKSAVKLIKVQLGGESFSFYTDNGVFSKRGLDFGTRTMLETLLKEKLNGDVLDLGCGYGTVGIILSKFFKINVLMTDVNKRALHLALKNVKLNALSNVKILESNIYENIISKFDYIVTNPPIRAGKDVVYQFLFKACEYLKTGGALYFVINKNQGANSVIRDLKKIAKVTILEKNKGFFVIKCIFDWQLAYLMLII